MADKRAALYPDVPTLKEATGSDWTLGAWRGVGAPKGIPADASAKLAAAIDKIVHGKEYNEFMAKRGYGVVYAGPGGLRQDDGEVGRRSRRDDEGGRPREVTRMAGRGPRRKSAARAACP